MACFNISSHFVYTMKTHKGERTFLMKKYAHNVTQYGVQKQNIVPYDVFTISHS